MLVKNHTINNILNNNYYIIVVIHCITIDKIPLKKP